MSDFKSIPGLHFKNKQTKKSHSAKKPKPQQVKMTASKTKPERRERTMGKNINRFTPIDLQD